MSDIFFSLFIIIIASGGIFFYVFNYMPNRKEHVKDLYAEGLDLLIEGKRKAAYQNFKDIIEKDSENIKAYLRLGQVLREGGNAQQALKIHKSLLHRKKINQFDKLELHKNLVLNFYQLDSLTASLNELNNIIKLDKSNEWATGYLVKIYCKMQDWKNAFDSLEKYQKLTNKIDNHKLALYKIQEGRVYLNEKKFRKSRKALEESIHICADIAAAYYFIANTYSEESEVAYQLSLENANHSESDISASNNSMNTAKELLSKAIPMWIRYAELKPKQAWMVIHLLKDSLFTLDRYSEIEEILKQILRVDKNNIEVIATLSEIFSHKGEEIEAMELIDSAIEQAPDSLLVKLIKMKHQAKKDTIGDKYIKGLDDVIHFLVKDESFQLYKDTNIDPDILWLYENFMNKENID